LSEDQVDFIKSSQITLRCGNEVSMESQTIMTDLQASKPNNASLSNVISKEIEMIVELADENNSLDDFVGNPVSQLVTSVESALSTNRLKNGNQLECPECGKILSNNFQLKKHFFSHRDKSEWPFECEICHEKARTKYDMNKHYMSRSHLKDPRFILL